MGYTRWKRRIGGLVLAAVLLTAAGCQSPAEGPAMTGQITEGNWGESPAGNGTLPDIFPVGTTAATGAETGTSSRSSAPSLSAPGTAAAVSGSGASTAGTTCATRTTAGGTTAATTAPATTETAPGRPASEELRGMWLCHLDMAAMFQGKTEEQAKAALDKAMDDCVSYGMNAVFFHARADSDAYYRSDIFRPAKAAAELINAGFDPLAYAVEAAHSRGLQLHAWINPYRIGADESYAVGNAEDRFWKYKNSTYTEKAWYYVPSSTAAQKTILDGIREIVDGYDIDGIHFDDYFYPDDSDPRLGINAEEPEEFESGYKPGGSLSLGDWRRAAVDSLVVQAYSIVHRKEGCVFGISPSHNLTRAREEQYADVAKWMAGKGYVDYICPQIYFGFEHNSSAFDKCVNEWLELPRASGVKLLVGIAAYKIGLPDDKWADSRQEYGTGARGEWARGGDILKRQVECLRQHSGIGGMIFFRYQYFDPDSTDGDAQIARKELENLQTVLNR